MFRIIRTVLVLSIFLIIGGGSYLYFTRVAKTEAFLSKKLHADVTVKDVKFGLKRFCLEKIKVTLPEYPNSAVFRADEIEVEFTPWDLVKPEIEISLVKIQNPVMGILLFNKSGSENNWIHGLKQSAASPSSKKFIIRTLKVINLHFEAYFASGKGLTLPPLPYLELHDIGSDHPLSFEEVYQHFLEKLGEKEPNLSSFFKNLNFDKQEGSGLKETFEDVKKKAKSTVKELKNFFSP